MHVYRHIALGLAQAPVRRLGQESPSIGVIVNGTQQLKEDVAANVMTFLQNRYFLADPTNSGGATGQIGYAAVTPQAVLAAGGQLEGQKTAAQSLGELGGQYIAIASVPDTMAVLQATPPEIYHLVVVDNMPAAQTIAQAGTNWAVLQPRGAPGGGGATASSSAEKGGLSTATIIGAVAGGLVGFVVGGPVGAVVGGLAVGALVNSTQK